MKVAKSVAIGAVGIILALYVWDIVVSHNGDTNLTKRAIVANANLRRVISLAEEAHKKNLARQIAIAKQAFEITNVANAFRDSASAADTVTPPTPDNMPAYHWYRLFNLEKSRADNLDLARDLGQQITILAHSDNNNAWTIIRQANENTLLNDEALHAKECHIAFLPCPSRTLIAILSFAGGAVATAIVIKKVKI